MANTKRLTGEDQSLGHVAWQGDPPSIQPGRVTCVGIACVDVLTGPVTGFPEMGKLSLVPSITMRTGGCAANAAVCLARLETPASLCACVGKDGFGHYLRDTVADQGVDVTGVYEDLSSQTASSVVFIDPSGERSILHCLGSNAQLNWGSMERSALVGSSILFIAGTFLMPAFDGKDTASLLRFGRERGMLTCLDTAWDTSGRWMSLLEDVLPLLDWFMPSEGEAIELSGSPEPPVMATRFLDRGVRNVVIKLGSRGCYIAPGRNAGFYSPAFPVRPVDTSGAGDAFCAGFLAGLARGWDTRDCARLANATGACCIRSVGTTDGVKNWDDTRSFIKNSRKKSVD